MRRRYLSASFPSCDVISVLLRGLGLGLRDIALAILVFSEAMTEVDL